MGISWSMAILFITYIISLVKKIFLQSLDTVLHFQLAELKFLAAQWLVIEISQCSKWSQTGIKSGFSRRTMTVSCCALCAVPLAPICHTVWRRLQIERQWCSLCHSKVIKLLVAKKCVKSFKTVTCFLKFTCCEHQTVTLTIMIPWKC